MKLKQLIKEIKGIFVLPKKTYYFGKLQHGCPYFYPYNYNYSIIGIRKLELTDDAKSILAKSPKAIIKEEKKYKNLPFVRRTWYKIFKIFGNEYYITIGYPIMIHRNELGWKDKWDSPRFEWSPAFYIFFFKWQFCIWWVAPEGYSDKYYEQILWFLYYSNSDIKRAKETWPWQDYETKKSSWDDKYLI